MQRGQHSYANCAVDPVAGIVASLLRANDSLCLLFRFQIAIRKIRHGNWSDAIQESARRTRRRGRGRRGKRADDDVEPHRSRCEAESRGESMRNAATLERALMANALLKACSAPGCPNLSAFGRCADHARLSAARRGYGAGWGKLRLRFRRALIAAGVAPVCGARLPTATPAPPSRCLESGQLIDDSLHRLRFGTALHTDHIIPHNGDRVLFTTLTNFQLLCRDEHSAKTRREQRSW